jgi:acyl-CoA thioester hydrolase
MSIWRIMDSYVSLSGIYRYDFRVPEDVVDENGHVNNVVYVRWMQEAAIRHSESVGCTQATKAVGASWIVRSHEIEYLQPVFAGDDISILTWVSNFRKVRSLRKYKFIRTCDNTVLAQGATDWVFIDTQRKRPRLISKEIREVFELVTEEQEP